MVKYVFLFITNFLFLITQYDIKWTSAAFHSTLLAAVMGMCELIVYNIIARTAPHFYMQMDSFHNTVLLILCSKISFFAVIYLLTHLFKSLQGHSDTEDNSVLLLIIIPVASVFIMLTFVNINDHYTLSAETNCLVSLSALFLLFMNLLIFGINQYSRKKIGIISKCNFYCKKRAISQNIIRCCFHRTQTRQFSFMILKNIYSLLRL